MPSKRDLNGAVFNTELDDFCRKYFIISNIEPSQEEALAFENKYDEMKTSLFENFILHNEVNFRIQGENLPLAVMINEIGLRGVEELIDEEALSFTIWSPLVLMMADNQYGVVPLCAGRRDNSVFSDPEESIHTGLSIMKNPLKKGELRAITRKIRDLYISVPKGLENDSVNVTMSALESGKLEKLGLSLKNKDKYDFSEDEKQSLITCAADLLAYKFLILKRAQVSPTSNIAPLLKDSMQKTNILSKDELFSAIVEFENIPDIRTSFFKMGMPMDELVKLRKNRHSKKFRNWISTLNGIKTPLEAQRFYVESIQSSKGFFDTFWGKSTKSVAMMMLGACIGSTIDHKFAPLVGAAGAQLITPISDYLLDMADEYLISELIKGWTPKLFISEIKSLNFKYSASN